MRVGAVTPSVYMCFSLNRCRQGAGDRRRNGWRPMKPLSGHVAACRRATVMGSSVRSERDQSWGQPPTTRGWVAQCVRRGHSCTTSPDAARAPQPCHLRHSDGAAATTATSSPQRLLSSLLTSRAHRHHRRLLLPPALLIELLYERAACPGRPRLCDHLRLTYLLSGLFLNDQTVFERMNALSGVTGDYATLVSAYCSWLRHRRPSLNDIAATRRRLPGHHYDLPGDDTVRHLCGADSTFPTCGLTGYGWRFLASPCSSGAPPRPVLLSSSDALQHQSATTPIALWRYMYD